MEKAIVKQNNRMRRHARIRAKVSGTATRPRLAVFKSNRSLYIQLIDDENSATLFAADSRKAKGKTPTEKAIDLGKQVAEAAKKKKIEAIVFDRGGFKYQGVIAALADSAREGGLVF